MVTVELRDASGNLVPNSGATIVWQPGSSGSYVPFGDGTLNPDGTESMETLPLTHRFHMTYNGITKEKQSSSTVITYRLSDFGMTTVSITITSSPTGIQSITVDGTLIMTPQTFSWLAGSSHSLEALSVVSGPTGIQYVFTGWSDSGERFHTYTVPSSSQTLTAYYQMNDILPPTVTVAFPTPNGENGWFVSSPVGSVTATDNLAVTSLSCTIDEQTIALSDLTGLNTPSAQASFSLSDDGTHVIGCIANDGASNSGSDSETVMIDSAAPVLGNCPIAGPWILNSVQTVGPIEAGDVVSGLNSDASALTALVNTGTVGTTTVTFKAVDNAGNSASKSCPYNVIYRFTGFLPPVDNPPVVNLGRAGRTIPLKFQLSDANGVFISSTTPLPATIKIQEVACSTFNGDPVDPNTLPDANPTGSTSLRYDPTTNQWIFNWQTSKTMAGKCYKIIVYQNNPNGTVSSIILVTAYFQLKPM